MNRQLKKSTILKYLISLVIVLLGIIALFLWKVHMNHVKRQTEPPVKLGAKYLAPRSTWGSSSNKIVLRSSLAEKGWYPADANALKKQVESLFQKADVKPINNVIALILPHAGYTYSGQVAANGLKTIDKKYERIIVIGPSHYIPMEEVLSVPRVTHYETPMGEIPLDVEFINKLLKHSVFQNVPQTHQYEHSVQIELPLIQYCQKDFKLVPIVAGHCSAKTIEKASKILLSLIDQQTLIIASSDFTHYGANYDYVPFTENVPDQIKKLDMGAYDYIAKLDGTGFQEYIRKTGATICGYVPISILLSMLDKNIKAELIKYTTSGQLMGDFNNSVSYFSITFFGAWTTQLETQPQTSTSSVESENEPKLTEEDKKQLLTLARKTISYALQNKRVPQASELGFTISDAMADTRAAFVTLKKNSQLRGCIGDIFPQRPLYKSVILNAINAGLNDWRFSPVTEAECKDIKIEISALTTPHPVNSYKEIRIGTDGVVLNKDGRSAVFLPQVAPEQGWDLNQMLTELSLKAGLPRDAWKEGASFLVFQAEVFGEE
jgi:AmmeMemoRadiSam system protein B/AmmeMemoRadiSam system protein A